MCIRDSINFYFYQISTGTAGNGVYQYQLPSGSVLGGLTYNTTDLVAMSNPTGSSAVGTKVGTAVLWIVNSSQEIGAVYFSNTGGVYYSNLNGVGLVLWSQVGNAGIGLQGSGLYQFGGTYLTFTFEAMIPII